MSVLICGMVVGFTLGCITTAVLVVIALDKEGLC